MKSIRIFATHIFTLLATLLFSFPPPFAEMGPPSEMGPYSSDWMSLSSQQKAKLESLQRRFSEEIAPLQGTLYARQLELRTLWADPRTSPSVLEAKEKEVLDLTRQIQERALRYRLEARSLLEPNQIMALQGGYWLFRGLGRGLGYGGGYGMGAGPAGRGYGQGGRGAGRGWGRRGGPNYGPGAEQRDMMGPPRE